MIGAEALRALVGAGLDAGQILAVVEAMAADARPKDANAAERQRRRRARLQAERDGGRDARWPETQSGAVAETAGIVGEEGANHVGAGVTPPVAEAVTAPVAGPVTGPVTPPVTLATPPLDENISNPPRPSLTPDGVGPLKRVKAARARRLPDDFVMPADWKAWARAERGWAASAIESEAANFCDYWQARGSGAAKRDWRKAWQNWVRSAKRPDGDDRDRSEPSREEKARAAEQYAARLERIGRPEDAAEIRRRWSTGPPRAPLDCLPPALKAGLGQGS